jgi:hypothetical protein
MGILKSIFGPSKNEIWSQIAADMGEEFIEGGFLKGSPALVYKHGEWQIRLDTYTKDSGNSNRTYTRVRAPFINKDELYFKIYREGFFSDIGKFLGMQDIKTGDPFFDEQFIIKSNNRKKLKLFLADPKMKELIQGQPKIHLEIRDDEGWFGADFPEGVDELYFECVGVIEETERLKSLFDLFSVSLMRLVQIDSAYEDDPEVDLSRRFQKIKHLI